MSNQLRVANAPCSWGALEFNWAGQMPPYETVLDEMTSTGYAGTELGRWGFMPTEPEALSVELSRRQLALTGAFVPVQLTVEAEHTAGVEDAIRVARLLVQRPPATTPLSSCRTRRRTTRSARRSQDV